MSKIEDSPREHDFQYFEKPLNQQDGIMSVTHKEHRSGSDNMSDGTAVTATSAYKETGAPINRSMTAEEKKEANSALTWSKIRRSLREPLSEFMGV